MAVETCSITALSVTNLLHDSWQIMQLHLRVFRWQDVFLPDDIPGSYQRETTMLLQITYKISMRGKWEWEDDNNMMMMMMTNRRYTHQVMRIWNKTKETETVMKGSQQSWLQLMITPELSWTFEYNNYDNMREGFMWLFQTRRQFCVVGCILAPAQKLSVKPWM